MIEKCNWCAGSGVRFGDVCMVCAGAGFRAPNPRLFEVTFTIQADEVVLTRDFLSRIDHSLICAATGSPESADRVLGALGDLLAELGQITPSLADMNVEFPEIYARRPLIPEE